MGRRARHLHGPTGRPPKLRSARGGAVTLATVAVLPRFFDGRCVAIEGKGIDTEFIVQ